MVYTPIGTFFLDGQNWSYIKTFKIFQLKFKLDLE